MKVWEKIAELNSGQLQLFTDSCPAKIEYRYNLIGKKKMDNFCKLGCSVICLQEYLNLEVK